MPSTTLFAASPRLALVLALALATGARAQPLNVPVKAEQKSQFTFNLLPKSFQRNPELELTVNTEMTPYGRLMRSPTPANPMYYISHNSGYKQMGDTVGGDNPPHTEVIEAAMKKALATNGYLPATSPDQKPSLVVLYFFGAHYRLDRETEQQFPSVAAKHRLERAMLVGGKTFMQRTAQTLEWGEQLTDRTADYEYLRDQANDDLYYVVASAYDYIGLSHKERKLVWRTTMTANAKGVSMHDTMLPLIATGGPFFGRETPEPQILFERVDRWKVQVGEPTVVESDVRMAKPATPAPAKK